MDACLERNGARFGPVLQRDYRVVRGNGRILTPSRLVSLIQRHHEADLLLKWIIFPFGQVLRSRAERMHIPGVLPLLRQNTFYVVFFLELVFIRVQ